MAIAYISFGSNKGDRSKKIAKALDLIRKHFTILDISSFYESEPVYNTQKNNFLNGVVKIETTLKIKELYNRLKNIEILTGRVNVGRDEDKPIDLDLLYYGDKKFEEPPVIVPHHKIHQRKYILAAMTEIEPDFIHPVFNKSQKELLKELKDKKKVKIIPNNLS